VGHATTATYEEASDLNLFNNKHKKSPRGDSIEVYMLHCMGQDSLCVNWLTCAWDLILFELLLHVNDINIWYKLIASLKL